ncbi:MAG: glycosyltransferase family 4 protein [Candidatus Methanoperedens sp.]|nr:glycosyltransferase family 4 protein [Candidatus Methanoperedens sp.]
MLHDSNNFKCYDTMKYIKIIIIKSDYYTNRILFVFEYLYKLIKNIFRESIDIIFVHYLLFSIFGIIAKLITGRKMVSWAWGSDIRSLPNKNIFYRYIVKAGLKFSDKIISPHPETHDLLVKLNVPKNKIIDFQYSVDVEKFKIRSPDKELLDDLGLTKEFVVLYLGRLDSFKGCEFIIESIPFVTNEEKNVKIIFVGDGDQEKLQSMAEELGVENYVFFTGAKRHVEKYYSIATVIVLPSITENIWSAVLMEALASGKAIITTDVGYTSFFLKDLVLIVEPKNPIAIAKSILRIIYDDKLRKELERKSREYAEQNLNSSLNYRKLNYELKQLSKKKVFQNNKVVL